jgi:group I intron endonuclease
MGDRYYIGSTKNLRDRRWRHLRELKRQIHKNRIIQSIYNKYGEEYLIFSIIEEVSEDKDLLNVEQTYLDEHFGLDNCVNLAKQSMGGKINTNPWQAHEFNKGKKRSEETKKLQSDSAKKLHKEKPHLMEAIREKAWAATAEYRKNKYPPFYLIKDGVEYGPFNSQKEVHTSPDKLMSNMALSKLYQKKVETAKGFTIKFIPIDK